MNPDKNSYSVKLSWVRRWRQGVGLLWRLFKLYFFFNVFCIPSYLAWVVVDSFEPQSKGIAFLAWFIGFVVASINIPLALIYAAEETGFPTRDNVGE